MEKVNTLTPQIIMSHGFTGKRVGEILKNSKGWSEAQLARFIEVGELPVFPKKDLEVKEWSVLQWFIENECVRNLFSSSNSQKRRWLEEGAVEINGAKLGPNDPFPHGELRSLVFFYGSKFQITML